MEKHKGVKQGWEGMNYSKSRHFEKMKDVKRDPNSATLRKKLKEQELGKSFNLNNDSIEKDWLEIDASSIKTINDIKLIIEFMELKFKPKDSESFEKIKHLLKK